jgi:suppressor of tumorigenicity protein 13
MTIAKRSEALLSCKRVKAALSDAEAAIALNPDSARSLRAKGKALRRLGKYEDAMAALGSAQSIDFNEDAAVVMKEIKPFVEAIKKFEVEERKVKRQRWQQRA